MVDERKLKVVIFFFAGIVGVLFTKAFLFDNIELIAWNIFWNGNSSFFNSERIFTSTTFLKSIFGFLIFGFIGVMIFKKYSESKLKN
jgi:hypothetical protein